MTTNTQIRAKTASNHRRPPNRAHRRRPEPRADRPRNPLDPRKSDPRGLDFHRSPGARPAASSARSTSWPTTPKTCKFARAGRRQPHIGLVARPASPAQQGRGPRALLRAVGGALCEHRPPDVGALLGHESVSVPPVRRPPCSPRQAGLRSVEAKRTRSSPIAGLTRTPATSARCLLVLC